MNIVISSIVVVSAVQFQGVACGIFDFWSDGNYGTINSFNNHGTSNVKYSGIFNSAFRSGNRDAESIPSGNLGTIDSFNNYGNSDVEYSGIFNTGYGADGDGDDEFKVTVKNNRRFRNYDSFNNHSTLGRHRSAITNDAVSRTMLRPPNTGIIILHSDRPRQMINCAYLAYIRNHKNIVEHVTNGQVYINNKIVYTAPTSYRSLCVRKEHILLDKKPVFDLTDILSAITASEPKPEDTAIESSSPSQPKVLAYDRKSVKSKLTNYSGGEQIYTLKGKTYSEKVVNGQVVINGNVYYTSPVPGTEIYVKGYIVFNANTDKPVYNLVTGKTITSAKSSLIGTSPKRMPAHRIFSRHYDADD